MRTLTQHLVQYAARHRDARNVATHRVGIPLIVIGIDALLARAAVDVGGHALSLACVATLASIVFSLVLDRVLGVVMTAALGACLAIGSWAASQPTVTWLAIGVGGFAVGWVFPFVGHLFEGRKPAFVDDVVGLVVGPRFVVAEAAFALGPCLTLAHAVHAGGARLRVDACDPS